MKILKTTLLVAFVFAAFCTFAFAAEQGPYVVKSGGAKVLALKLPKGCEAEVQGDKTIFADRTQKPKFEFQLWVIPGTKTVKDVVNGIGEVIKSEFLELKLKAVEDVKVANGPGKLIVASGVEADDGDPGNAKILVFHKGKNVFVACVHGEGDYAATHYEAMLSMLKMAR